MIRDSRFRNRNSGYALAQPARGRTAHKASCGLALALLAALLIVLLSLPSRSAGFEKNAAGTSTAQFLKIAAGARGAGLGEAFSAAADDATAMDWNPACLIRVRKQSVALMHSPYLAGSYADFFGYAQNAGDVGSWGMSLKYMNYGSIKRTDTAGASLGDFTPYDMAAAVGFATYITGFNKDPEERFTLGATGKLVRSKLLSADNTVSADIGILFPYYFDNRFQLALSAQNIMGTLRYDRQEFPLPLTLRLGSATRFGDSFLVTADVVAPRDNYPFLAMGGEFRGGLGKSSDLFLRAGFNTRAVTDLGGLRNLTFGSGFRFGVYAVDYSFSPFGELGSVHRISAGMNF